ncbi:MAG: sulfide/dihydroorotate dehydrogenase-like FAD/NAD-binding protein [Chloroflexota bacterium]|nr:sulfide/dihydroorotate dehydrogenase-like FAD/NAD-binding protein [Chloroflexota bacterium]
MAKILSTRQLTPITKLFVVDAPLVAEAARPGQFVILRVREGGERIPVTIADYDRAARTIAIVVQEVGVTTRLVNRLGAGDDILDVVGPLGTPVEIPAGGHVVGVGGGFGAAALLCLMRELTARGDRTTSLLGARTKELLILVDELRAVSTNVELCTDDGSAGYHGLVTGRLAELIAGQGPGRPDHVIAIGPEVMMRAVAEATRPERIHTLVSMDPLMIDGTGMCGGCRVIVGGESKFACVDGPCFDAHQVDFTVAMRRGKAYAAEEKLAAERLAAAGGR